MVIKVYSPDAEVVNRRIRETFRSVDVNSMYVHANFFSIHNVKHEGSKGFTVAALFQFCRRYGYGVEIM